MDQKEFRKFMGQQHYAPQYNPVPEAKKEGWFVKRRHSVDSVGYERRDSVGYERSDSVGSERRDSVSSISEEQQIGSPVMNSVLQANLQAKTTQEMVQNNKSIFREFDFK